MNSIGLEEVDTYVPVYCHSANTGAMYGGGAMTRSTGNNDMVGSGWPQLRAGGDGDGVGCGGSKG